ncbi:MAG: TIR domain-containing protein [Chitinophagales bacterium]
MTDSDDPLPSLSSLYDVFISFSVKDRIFVKDLYEMLVSQLNIQPWYSGEKLRGKYPSWLLYDINKAIRQSKYCIAVFSRNTIDSKWFYAEVGGFFAKETLHQRRIIPILYEMNYEEFLYYFPLFADRFAITEYHNFEAIGKQILKFIFGDQSIIKSDAFQPIEDSKNWIRTKTGLYVSSHNIITSSKEISRKDADYSISYQQNELISNDSLFEIHRVHANIFQLLDQNYFLKMTMEKFFSTITTSKQAEFSPSSSVIYDSLMRRNII